MMETTVAIKIGCNHCEDLGVCLIKYPRECKYFIWGGEDDG